MESKQYINDRVEDQISYYDTNSSTSRNWYKGLTGIQIVCGAAIPLLSGFSSSINYSEWVIALLGVAITCSTGFLLINKFQERWIHFRTTCEILKHLKNLYITNAKPYNDDESYTNFVNDIEMTISKENSNWGAYIRKQPDTQ